MLSGENTPFLTKITIPKKIKALIAPQNSLNMALKMAPKNTQSHPYKALNGPYKPPDLFSTKAGYQDLFKSKYKPFIAPRVILNIGPYSPLIAP